MSIVNRTSSNSTSVTVTAPGTQAHFLQDVLRILDRAQHPVAMHLQLPSKRVDQLAKRATVSGAGPGQ